MNKQHPFPRGRRVRNKVDYFLNLTQNDALNGNLFHDLVPFDCFNLPWLNLKETRCALNRFQGQTNPCMLATQR